jgi:2-keto-4-pentenoate hydratase/2-oxohepta-3-ene-1,7-dioic acid hydratase in catechol pathway
MKFGNLDDRLVLVTADGAIDVATASGGRLPADPQAALDRWDEVLAWAATGAGDPVAFDDVALGPPVPRPRQVFAIGLNYASHAAESGADAPAFPPTFTKFPTSLTGPFATVALPGDKVDWEVELVVVVGAPTHRVRSGDAWRHVAGVTVGQDLSERAVQWRPPVPQFSLGKSFPGFSPTGPHLVTVDELDDPDDLAICCRLNGETVQEGRTSELIFGVGPLIEALSAVVPLLPGDLVFTGTPSGVGATRTPPRFLAPGDQLVSTVEGVGTIVTRFEAGDRPIDA